MNLNFPNPSRSFDANRSRVCFWGYDRAIEVAFFVEGDALKRLCPTMSDIEAGFLQAFDTMRERIYEIANKVYMRDRKHAYSYVLAENDFK
jgi:hypothetical protein